MTNQRKAGIKTKRDCLLAVEDGMNQKVVQFLKNLMMVMINMCCSTVTVIEAV
jgi:hypothetical protein